MRLPFTRDAFFDVFTAYNERLWPLALVLWLLTFCAFVMLVRARRVSPLLISGLLSLHWVWTGLAYHAAFFTRINPAAWVFSGLFLLEGGLLAWFGGFRDALVFSRGHSIRHVLSSVLITYSLLYPVIARAEGHVYPKAPTFGVPVPPPY